MSSGVSAGHPIGGLEVRLLGGVEVHVADRRVPIGGAKPRAILALLALQPNAAVSIDRVVDDVWGEHAPPTVRASVQVHVSNLRRSLATAGVASLVETRGSGYAFTADPATVDVHRFALEARQAREAFSSGNLDAASVNVRQARTIWRGVPLAGIGDAPFVTSRVASLESDFLALIDLYADIEIALGRSAEAVGELESVVAEHPYREPTWARLALALYRAGRQVDALARLRTVRRVLAEDLGLEPSEDLAALEVAILNQDPALRGDPHVSAERTAARASSADGLLESRLPRLRPLIGRDDLVRLVVDSVERVRLVTITGPGGVGKTSVAVAAAAALTDVSARFVDLAAVDDASGLVPSLLAAIGSRSDDLSHGVDSLVSTLNSYRSPIIVLDNCEHVLDAAADVVVDLLDQCADLRVLATSREPLAIPDEMIISCPPLPSGPGVALFVARAHATDRLFAVTEEEGAAIEMLVQRLEGLPLAIELFAARVHALSAVEMLRRLDDEELLSTSWRRARADRHRSLHAVVAWSYSLLNDEERRCLRRLSVFGGSIGEDAVNAICGPIQRTTLNQLVARSLVTAERTVVGTRFRLLAPVRAFAAAELAGDEDVAEVRRRLVDWVTAWAAGVAAGLAGEDPATSVEELEMNAPNVRVAYEFACARPGGAAKLLAAFGPWALSTSLALPEAVSWARSAAAEPAAEDRDRMPLLVLIARLSYVGTPERKAGLRAAMELAEALGDDAALAAAWAEYALAATDVAAESLAASERAIDLAHRAQQPVTLAWGLNTAVTSLLRQHRFVEAATLLDRHCVTGTRRFGPHEAHVLYQHGRLAMLQGDLAAARAHFVAAEQATIRSRVDFGRSAAWYGIAEVDRLSGHVEAAYAGYRRCLPMDLILEPGETGLVRMMIVWTGCLLGELEVAEHHAAVLADEYAMEKIASDDDSMIAAAATCAQGLLALAKGMTTTAASSLLHAIRLWASSDSWDIVADLIDRLPELHPEPERIERLRSLAAAVRSGSASLDEAIREVEHLSF